MACMKAIAKRSLRDAKWHGEQSAEGKGNIS